MKKYIIRLKDNIISNKHANECMVQAKKYNINLEYFDAINGLEYKTHIDKLNIKPKYFFKEGRAGVFGCFLSHYYLWKKCVEDNIPYLILEHDGYIIKKIPDDILTKFTDVLKLDDLDPYSTEYNNNLNKLSLHPITYKKYYNSMTHLTHLNMTGNYMRGAYGYIIKPHAAKNLIDWINKNGFLPADIMIGDLIVNIMVCIPSIVRIHPNYLNNNMKLLSLTQNPNLL